MRANKLKKSLGFTFFFRFINVITNVDVINPLDHLPYKYYHNVSQNDFLNT